MAGNSPVRQEVRWVLFALAAAEINPRLVLAPESKQILKFKSGLMANSRCVGPFSKVPSRVRPLMPLFAHDRRRNLVQEGQSLLQ
jgi:hypothetical protein